MMKMDFRGGAGASALILRAAAALVLGVCLALVSSSSAVAQDAPHVVTADKITLKGVEGLAAPDGLAGGENKQIQFNDGGELVGAAGLNWDSVNFRLGVGTADPQAAVDVRGGVKVGNDTNDCTDQKAGTIRFTGKAFEGCNGKAWVALEAAKGR